MWSSNTTSSFAPPPAKASDGSPWGEYHAKVPPGNAVKHARLREVSSCLLSAPQFIEPVESAAAVKRGAKVFTASCSSCHPHHRGQRPAEARTEPVWAPYAGHTSRSCCVGSCLPLLAPRQTRSRPVGSAADWPGLDSRHPHRVAQISQKFCSRT